LESVPENNLQKNPERIKQDTRKDTIELKMTDTESNFTSAPVLVKEVEQNTKSRKLVISKTIADDTIKPTISRKVVTKHDHIVLKPQAKELQ
jgi:hypothetical protein